MVREVDYRIHVLPKPQMEERLFSKLKCHWVSRDLLGESAEGAIPQKIPARSLAEVVLRVREFSLRGA